MKANTKFHIVQKEVAPLISRIENYVENLKNLGPG